MITKVRLRYFKQFRDEEIDLDEHVLLVGPNNSGKTTLLQAIAVWQLALERWRAARRPESRGKQRAAVPITRKDFTAIPLREMKLLWTDTSTALKKEEAQGVKPGSPRIAEVTLEGRTGDESWELPFEFRYQGAEQIYVKPAERYLDELPRGARDLRIVHVPAFSGIGAQETRYDRPYQNLLIGQGKPGDLLRNLLLEVYQLSEGSAWEELSAVVEGVFHYRLLPPEYEGSPFILCEYLPGIPGPDLTEPLPRLDIACAGSGFHQVLLLLAFLFARPATILLVDEPDAHQHVILQQQVYDLLRQIAARRRCQLLIATHSEVLINATSPDSILSFFARPHRLLSDVERQQVAQALRRLPALDLLLAERSGGVLYTEGETDYNLLKAWAKVLGHPFFEWLNDRPFWMANRGRNPRDAKAHFFALRAIQPEIRGVLLLDGDNRSLPDREVTTVGLDIARWRRYEIESYLLHPGALLRFVEKRSLPLLAEPAKAYLKDQLPPAVYREPLADHDFLVGTPASKTLLPAFFEAAQLPTSKQEYYQVAEQMQPEEIAQEVVDLLDLLARSFGLG